MTCHAVWKKSTTTKVRVVLNKSVKSSNLTFFNESFSVQSKRIQIYIYFSEFNFLKIVSTKKGFSSYEKCIEIAKLTLRFLKNIRKHRKDTNKIVFDASAMLA